MFALPLVILGIILMVNHRKLMDKQATGYLLNTVLGFAFLFALVISYNGVLGLIGD